jgi:hypothetical protein
LFLLQINKRLPKSFNRVGITSKYNIMSKGMCGEHHYANIDKEKIDAILAALKKSGATIKGDNPWDVDVHSHGVKLRGTWNESTSTLSIIVTAKDFYVPCSKIWDKIDPLIHHITGLSSAELV